jgi:hypothetical protein
MVTPKNGTAPYTLLIAPAFHPPVNITASSMTSMNYTIRVTHGQAFMIGVYDSAGNSFAFGPLHSGDSDDLSCLQVATGQSLQTTSQITGGALAGAVVGAFMIGAIGAAAILWAWGKKLEKKLRNVSQSRSSHGPIRTTK